MALKQKSLVLLNKILSKGNSLIKGKKRLPFFLIFFISFIFISEIAHPSIAQTVICSSTQKLSDHTTPSNCWIMVKTGSVKKLYNVSNATDHPGGHMSDYIDGKCGKEATNFHKSDHGGINRLDECCYICDVPSSTPVSTPISTPISTPVSTPVLTPIPTPVFSPPPSQSPVPLPSIIGLTNKSIVRIVNNAIVWLLGAVASLAILLIVIGGIYYITASGDERRMDTAKNIITYAIMGLFLAAIAYAIIITVNKVVA